MRQVTVNRRGQVMPVCLQKERRDVTPVTFDFGNLLTVSSYTIEGDAPRVSDSQDGNRVTVVLDAASVCRTYDLTVKATDGTETRAATVQIQNEDRERGWNSFGADYI